MSEERKYPWYEIVSGDEKLHQGDFIYECPVVIPPEKLDDKSVQDFKIIPYNVVILSQSCDLEHKKINIVLVCPLIPLSVLEKETFFNNPDGKNDLRKGNQHGYHLLNKCELSPFNRELVVVDFRNVYGIHYKALIKIAKDRGNRLRLLSPYVEHLSQAFARYFMRVGLPIDIPEFK